MKKIFAFLVCVAIICAMPLVAFAEEADSFPVETEATTVEYLTIETEEATEGEIEATEEVTEETPDETIVLTTDQIVKWIEGHIEEISVIVTLVFTVLFQAIKHTALNKSVALCNNNAVSIVEHSNEAIDKALAKVEGASAVVESYKEQIVALLAEIRHTDEEKKRLEEAFTAVENYLKTAKMANKELANEVAELLILANIPNSKKEELYARHRAAVEAIDAADKKTTEVIADVGEEA